jgi:hypothetical protein
MIPAQLPTTTTHRPDGLPPPAPTGHTVGVALILFRRPEDTRVDQGWVERLGDLFAGLSQDPLEDAPAIMYVLGTPEERSRWLADLDAAEAAAVNGDPRAAAVVNLAGGYRVATPGEAAKYFREVRALYLAEVG